MDAVEPTTSVCAPQWAEAFPRLFEIYTASDRASAGNWFQQPNVWRGLLDNSTGLQPLEEDLQVLDPASRAVFQVKAARLVHLIERGYSRPLFDCFNEIKGYRYFGFLDADEFEFGGSRHCSEALDATGLSDGLHAVVYVSGLGLPGLSVVPGEIHRPPDSRLSRVGVRPMRESDARYRPRTRRHGLGQQDSGDGPSSYWLGLRFQPSTPHWIAPTFCIQDSC